MQHYLGENFQFSLQQDRRITVQPNLQYIKLLYKHENYIPDTRWSHTGK